MLMCVIFISLRFKSLIDGTTPNFHSLSVGHVISGQLVKELLRIIILIPSRQFRIFLRRTRLSNIFKIVYLI